MSTYFQAPVVIFYLKNMRMKKRVLLSVFCLVQLSALWAQYSQGTLSFIHQPLSFNGGDGDIECKITAAYKLYIESDNPMVELTWTVEPLDYLIWDRKKYTRQDLGSDLFSRLVLLKRFYCEADLYYGGELVTTIVLDASTGTNVSNNTASVNTGPPNLKGRPSTHTTWNLFVGRSDAECKKMWMEGLRLTNMRYVSTPSYGANAPTIRNADEVQKAVSALGKDKQPASGQQGSGTKPAGNQGGTSSVSSSAGSITGTPQQQYDRYMEQHRIAVTNGDYGAAQQALQQANSIKPVTNYEALNYSLGVLNNSKTTGSALGLAQQDKLAAYSDLVTTGIQIIGDFAAMREERKRAEAQARQQEVAIRQPLYHEDLFRSQSRLLVESDTSLQQILSESYQAPLTNRNLSVLTFQDKIFIPAKIDMNGQTVRSEPDKVLLEKNGKTETIIGNIHCPWIIAGPSKQTLMIAFYRQDPMNAEIMVYDLSQKKQVGAIIPVNGLVAPLGFNKAETEVFYSNDFYKINRYNLGSGHLQTWKLDTKHSTFFGAVEMLNHRYIKQVSEQNLFISLYDVETGRYAFLPRIRFHDITDGNTTVPDHFVWSFWNETYVSFMNVDSLQKYYGKDFFDRYDSYIRKGGKLDEANELMNELFKFYKSYAVANVELKFEKYPHKLLEDIMENRVYTQPGDELMYAFPKSSVRDGFTRLSVNSPLLMKGRNITYATKENGADIYNGITALQKATDLYVLTIKNNIMVLLVSDHAEFFTLDYYPVRILENDKNKVTLLGIDRFAFPIVKTYDLNKYFRMHGFIDRTANLEALKRAKSMRSAGDYHGAIAVCDKVIGEYEGEMDAYVQRGYSYVRLKEYDKAHADFTKAIELDDNSSHNYNMACLFALQNNTPEALKWLELAFQKGMKNVEHVKTDGDLQSIRNTAEFKALLGKYFPGR